MNEKAVETKQRVQQHAGLRSQQSAQGLQVPHAIMSWDGEKKTVENVRRTILRQKLFSAAILEQQT